jgi:hypothetical protein
LRPWLDGRNAPALTRGLRVLLPGRRLRFLYGAYISLISDDSQLPKEFDVSVSYRLAADGRVKTETLHVDLMDYFGSIAEHTAARELGETISKGLTALTKQVDRLGNLLDQHVGPMSTASGVTLSVTALRNLRHLLTGSDQIEKVNPTEISVIEEVLAVDQTLAITIWEFLHGHRPDQALETLEGVTPDLAAEIRRRFII